mgnify:CR=1 FL=1
MGQSVKNEIGAKIHVIVSGGFSDWNIHGFLTSRTEAEKYCALKNRELNDDLNSYYVVDISLLEVESESLSEIKVKHHHTVIIDINKGIRNEPNRYEYYIGKDRANEIACCEYTNGSGWVIFKINSNSRENAESLAKEMYEAFLEHRKKFKTEEVLEMIKEKYGFTSI